MHPEQPILIPQLFFYTPVMESNETLVKVLFDFVACCCRINFCTKKINEM